MSDDSTIYQLWEQLREKCNRQHRAILDMLFVLEMEADWRDRHNRDGTDLRNLIARIRRELAA